MEPPELLEYPLTLRTGEKVLISELDPQRSPGWISSETREQASSVLDRCTYATREEVEAAKAGDTKPLERRLGTPPEGCLVKADLVCSEIRTCPSADKKTCRTSSRPTKKLPGGFPMCWSSDSVSPRAASLTTAIVSAWRGGRTVVIVDDEIGPPRRAPR